MMADRHSLRSRKFLRPSDEEAPSCRLLSRRSLAGPAAFLFALLIPAPVSAQFGALEALASNVTDLSFFGGFGRILPTTGALASGRTTFSFGVELLLEITSVDRPIPGAPERQRSDSVELSWTRMEVVRSEEGVDTVYFYDVEEVPLPPPAMEKIWSVEMGIGYGQFSGLELSDPTLQFRGSIRDLPAATVYASYEPWSTYFGLRTGFMRTKGLQVFDEGSGERFSGDAEAFLAGVLVGRAWSVGDFWGFAEAAYTSRYFPSVEWSGGTLPEGIPTELQASGWSFTTGIQFPIR